jgi:hypothetical protein
VRLFRVHADGIAAGGETLDACLAAFLAPEAGDGDGTAAAAARDLAGERETFGCPLALVGCPALADDPGDATLVAAVAERIDPAPALVARGGPVELDARGHPNAVRAWRADPTPPRGPADGGFDGRFADPPDPAARNLRESEGWNGRGAVLRDLLRARAAAWARDRGAAAADGGGSTTDGGRRYDLADETYHAPAGEFAATVAGVAEFWAEAGDPVVLLRTADAAADTVRAALDRPLGVEHVTDADWSARALVGVRGPDGPVRAATVTLGGETSAAPVFDGVAAVLAAGARRDPPGFPPDLAPTQVRLLPVDDRHRERCEQVAAALTGVRAAVDGDGTVVERVERAREEWVPWYAVVGDDDAGGPLPVTCPDGRERRLTAPELAVRVPETPTRAWLYPGR